MELLGEFLVDLVKTFQNDPGEGLAYLVGAIIMLPMVIAGIYNVNKMRKKGQ